MKTTLFMALFLVASLAAVANPAIGVFCYMANYIVAPDNLWWGAPLSQMGVRFSFSLVVCTALGMIMNWSKLREKIPGPLLCSQELLVCAFIGLVVVSRVWSEEIDHGLKDLSGTSESPPEKMIKVLIFLLIMTHVLVTYRQVRWLPWVLCLVGGLYTGLDAYTASRGRFVNGRLDVLGGTDFRESSMVAAHLAFVSTITGMLFLKCKRWYLRLICVISGGFSMNAIILTQTRAAVVGLGFGGILAPILAPKGTRGTILLYLVLGAFAAASLTNQAFWDRTETISLKAKEASAASRFDVWKAGLAMFRDHPIGVGAGGFYTVVGRYNPNYAGRDCHNTYIRCLAELGIPGGLLLASLIINAFRTLDRAWRTAVGSQFEKEIRWDCYGFQLALAVFLIAGVFMGLTYLEQLWWFLCIPVCLERAAINAKIDQGKEPRLAKLT